MKIYYSPIFAKQYKRLPTKIKVLAEKKEQIFRTDPKDPRLKTHRLSGRLREFWSFSINYDYRIVFEFRSQVTVWFHSVGTHQIYK